jgi:hypothetical protein
MEKEKRGEISWSLVKYFLGKEGICSLVEGSEVRRVLTEFCASTDEAKNFFNELLIELVKENLASSSEYD